MPLESLLELVETLRVRIDTHGNALRQSEALTRYALIDPLLRELGWDTSDPDMVVPEYRSGAGSADYALLSSGSPAMMVEAKKLGTPLQGVLTQGIGYCITEGIEYFSVTDGQRWEIYETHKPVPIDEKRIASWDLKDTSPGEVCLKLLALWRPSVQSGYIDEGHAPIIGISRNLAIETVSQTPPIREETPAIYPSSDPPSPPTQGQVSAGITAQQPPAVPRPSHQTSPHPEWKSLDTLTPESNDPRPTALVLPDSTDVPLRVWKDVMVQTVKWLVDTGAMNIDSCPIPYSSRSRRYIVHTTPSHPDGKPFNDAGLESIDLFYIDTKHSTPQTVKATCSIIQHVGQDPTEFRVRFS